MEEVAESIPFEQALIAQNDVLKDEVAMLKAECHELRDIIKAQAKAFADNQRAAPFENAIKALLEKEFQGMTLKLLRKLRADGFFKE